MPAKTVDEVIQKLDVIIDQSYWQKSRLGYFAALYRKVTVEVKKGIKSGFFNDGERMECFDVVFANRYFDALVQYQSNVVPKKSWQLAFEASKHFWPIVLQHLLLGMNSHINLDLGIAAAITSPKDSIFDLKEDFNKINDILASLVDEMQRKLAHIWPFLNLLDAIGGRTDEALINFSMERARDQAWKLALDLAPLEQNEQNPIISSLDKDIAMLARKIQNPGLIASAAIKIIRLGERGSIPQIIDMLR
ncbi:MAG: DUF5995 family protein [Desulfobacterales bacterium]|jgi:hypothetical protein